jgi:hypothetical protein
MFTQFLILRAPVPQEAPPPPDPRPPEVPTPPDVPIPPELPELFLPFFLPPDAIVAIATSLFAMIAIIAIGVPLVKVFARRLEQKGLPAPTSPDVVARLERIETAVDAIAIEVERISEGQRFAAKLLAERTGEPTALPGTSERGV